MIALVFLIALLVFYSSCLHKSSVEKEVFSVMKKEIRKPDTPEMPSYVDNRKYNSKKSSSAESHQK